MASLITQLREIADVAPSHQPTASERDSILGKLLAYVEHGDKLFEASAQDVKAREAGEPANYVNELLEPSPKEEEQQLTPEEFDRRMAQLQEQQQRQIARADAQRTQVSVEPGAGESPPPGAPPAPGEPS